VSDMVETYLDHTKEIATVEFRKKSDANLAKCGCAYLYADGRGVGVSDGGIRTLLIP
jgi:hypothetical protein